MTTPDVHEAGCHRVADGGWVVNSECSLQHLIDPHPGMPMLQVGRVSLTVLSRRPREGPSGDPERQIGELLERAAQRNVTETVVSDDPLPWSALRDSGLLWAVNRYVLHPRGFALALHFEREEDDPPGVGEPTGWSLLGDGSETWHFDGALDDERMRAFETFLAERRVTE